MLSLQARDAPCLVRLKFIHVLLPRRPMLHGYLRCLHYQHQWYSPSYFRCRALVQQPRYQNELALAAFLLLLLCTMGL
jgi:hypothetical protein